MGDNDGQGAIRRWLFNPFYTIAGATALWSGLAIILVTVFLGSVSQSHQDGALDFHSGVATPLWVYPFEGVVNWLSIALAMWAAGAFMSKSRIRPLDVFGTQALARWPMLVAVLAALLPGYTRFSDAILKLVLDGSLSSNPTAIGSMLKEAGVTGADIVMFAVTTVAVLLAIVWMVALMYRAYAVSCNVSGARGALSFIPALLVGYAMSKVVILLVCAGAQSGTTPEPGTPEFDVAERGVAYAALLSSGQFDEAATQFDEKMAKALSVDRLGSGWRDLSGSLGAFLRHGEPRVQELAGYTKVFVPCIFETGRFDVQVVYDGSGKVSGLWLMDLKDGQNNVQAESAPQGDAK